MKLVKFLKTLFYIFLALYALSFITSPLSQYITYGGFTSNQAQQALINTFLYGISGIIVCYHAAQILKSFQGENVSFKKMSNSFQWIAYTLFITIVFYIVSDCYFNEIFDESFWLLTFSNVLLVAVLSLFFLAISQIIKKADYYKTQNDLTI